MRTTIRVVRIQTRCWDLRVRGPIGPWRSWYVHVQRWGWRLYLLLEIPTFKLEK